MPADLIRALVVARQAGAAVMLIPVIRMLAEGGHRTAVAAAEQAADSFAQAGIPVLDLRKHPNESDLAALLARHRANLLLSGTSLEVSSDAVAWSAARRLGIRSLGMVDHWSLVIERFTVDQPLDQTPDAIGVIDDEMANRLLEHGYSADRIHVLGHPYLDATETVTAAARSQARSALNLDGGGRVLLLLSEITARNHGWPHDENEWAVAEAARTAVGGLDGSATLMVKLHPREDPEAWAEWAAQTPDESLLVFRACDPTLAIDASDVVLGMTSSLLIQAARAGVRTMRIVPPDVTDPFPGSVRPAFGTHTSVRDLGPALVAALQDPTPVAPTQAPPRWGSRSAVLGALQSLARESHAPW